ncbi:uncharacterized protein [Atheta coriaria]|uniref:uncharacterized protein n=1 Tax=Dalotia coriaria TaxID=877792 RepID=UPI0031F3716A
MSNYDFTDLARSIASRETINDHRLEYHSVSNKGDGYTGSVRAVSIVGSNKKLEVVFKYSHRDPIAHENLPLRHAYTSEIRFYEQIAPAFTKFQDKHNVQDPFNHSVAYYGCINEPLNECLAMENIQCSNYHLWDRKKQMNSSHLELALKTFAKLHGTSMAMKKLDPELYLNITDGLDDFNIWKDFVEKSDLYTQTSDHINTMNIFDPNTEKKYYEKLEYFRVNMKELIDPILDYHDKYDVILQGDCWNNNAMYQYDDENDRSTPTNIKLLDWQIIQTGSIVMDLSYFFYTIASKENIDDLDKYMKFYHQALADHLNAFDLNIEEVYPYSVFLNHWKKISLFGLIQAFSMRKMMLLEQEDAPDFAEGVDYLNTMYIDEEKDKLYKQQMKDIVIHFIDREFL